MTSDGRPYRPILYKEIVNERYIISKHAGGITYSDTAIMTPQERKLILQFIEKDYKMQQEKMQQSKQQRK